ncbi:MAG: hypothetical protein HOV81_21935 [Kofleriaceae bacterium]|nr:hypothetical protein [Kofleriaceae bacterium]
MALDLLEAELAVELPAHMRAFARAHADGRPPPAAPLIARLASTLQTARNACMHDVLADRGLALLRLVAPLVIEDDPAVVVARAMPPTWQNLSTLAAQRDAAARARFGLSSVQLAHRLHGVDATRHDHDAPGPAIEGWHERDFAIDHTGIIDAWQAIAARTGVTGTVRVDRSKKAHPRAFVIEPKVEVVIVVPEVIDTPAARFAVLHELGHAVAALALPAGVPRVVDEAAASYIARLAEPPSWLPPRWPSELAAAARRRRTALAAMLDEIERGLPTLADTPSSAPPWALWHDPGAQGSYVEAEVIADRLAKDLGPNPPRGQLVRALKAERDRVDHRTRI